MVRGKVKKVLSWNDRPSAPWMDVRLLHMQELFIMDIIMQMGNG